MFSKVSVRIPADEGVELGAWLFVPEGTGSHPAITTAHGFAGIMEHGLEPFAHAFAAAGFVVLVHDHRKFGTSGGEPRNDVDPQDASRRLAPRDLLPRNASRSRSDPPRSVGHELLRRTRDRRRRH